jgi:hypothetical protein
VQPGAVLKYIKEGTESSSFWSAIGGKQIFGGEQLTQETTRDPHLYSFSYNKGNRKVLANTQSSYLSILLFGNNFTWFLQASTTTRTKAFQTSWGKLEMKPNRSHKCGISKG